MSRRLFLDLSLRTTQTVTKGLLSENAERITIVSDGETMLTIINRGCEDCLWNLSSEQGSYDPMATVLAAFGKQPVEDCKDFYMPAVESHGLASVWFEPLTFWHSVHDLLNNY